MRFPAAPQFACAILLAGAAAGVVLGNAASATKDVTQIAVTSSIGVPDRGDTYLAFDGNTGTDTYTTPSGNTQAPSYLEFGFDGSTEVDRLRIYKDTYCGPHDVSIQYTTDSGDLTSRSYQNVTGMQNGFQGSELWTADSVNSDGTITGDSLTSEGDSGTGWASVVFDPVTATGMRIAFSDTCSGFYDVHYHVFELQVYDVTDSTAPDITPDVEPAPNGNGWNNTPVAVTWNVSEPDSWVQSTSNCDETDISSETTGTDVTCQATSIGGTNQQTATVKIDQTAPNPPTVDVSPDPNAAGWNNSTVNVTFTANGDGGGSGIAGDGCTTWPPITAETSGFTINGTCTDRAGNVSDDTETREIKIDETPPEVSCDSPDGSWHADNVTLSCTASDALSGLNDSGDASFGLSTSVADGSSDSSASTGSHADVCDVAGNCTGVDAISGNKIDRAAPDISCDSADGDWHDANVSIHCTASDGGSGLASSGDASFDLTTSVASGNENSNASTDSHQVCDNVGNCATAGPITGNKVDLKAPSLSCGSADGSWHDANVSIGCTGSDSGSGLANAGDSSFNLSTSVSSGTEDSNASTGTHQVCDVAGNCATAGAIAGNKVDRKAPTGSCASPDGNWHASNVSLGCTSADGGSGLANVGDASFNLTTSVAAGSESANASTGSHQVCDAVGNCTTFGPVSGNKVDRKAPSTSITNPSGSGTSSSPAPLGSPSLTVAFSVTDGGSGVASWTLTRVTAPLSGGSCGSFSLDSVVGGASGGSFTDPETLAYGKCYSWTLAGTDNLNNGRSVSSEVVRLAKLSPSTPSLVFGAVKRLTTKTLTETFTNKSGAQLKLTGVGVAGAGFKLAGGTCAAGKLIFVGMSCTASVSFRPTATGPFTGTLTVAGGGDTVAVPLTGTGT